MFSTNQLIFAICFVVAFVVLLVASYRKDIKQLKKQYKGTIWVLIGFIVFILFLLAIKSYLKS